MGYFECSVVCKKDNAYRAIRESPLLLKGYICILIVGETIGLPHFYQKIFVEDGAHDVPMFNKQQPLGKIIVWAISNVPSFIKKTTLIGRFVPLTIMNVKMNKKRATIGRPYGKNMIKVCL
ncbi:MAG: hypothetical protein SOX77_01900 [Candidatus Borkfalkiaceae bacterium]|nr:hypothetical protein [Christensenellaceae bacterium]